MKSINSLCVKSKNKISDALLRPIVAVSVALMSTTSFAQGDGQFNMPTANIPGVEEGGDTGSIALAALKWLGSFALWIFVMLMAFAMLKNIVKAVAKVRRDEETQWPDVIGQIAGNAGVMVVVVVLATWVQGFLA